MGRHRFRNMLLQDSVDLGGDQDAKQYSIWSMAVSASAFRNQVNERELPHLCC
jgi:hypothetical protein